MSKVIILSQYTRIGDRVQVQYSLNTGMYYINNKIPDGTYGTIIGFQRCNFFIGRNSQEFQKAGEYQSNGEPIILWDNGSTETINLNSIAFVDQSLNQIRPNDGKYIKAFKTCIFIAPLPLTKVVEGAIVKVQYKLSGIIDTLVVTSISYKDINKKCIDNITPYPIYQGKTIGEDPTYTTFSDAEIIEVITMGNYWAWENNNKSYLKFNDITDEVYFYKSLGFCEQVKNPISDDYGWSVKDVVEALNNNEIDVVFDSCFFDSDKFFNAFRFPKMPELGVRIREETLKGFINIIKERKYKCLLQL